MNGNSGKGSTPRPVDRQKFEVGYLRVFGINCPRCNPKNLQNGDRNCIACGGVGFVPKERGKK